MGERIQLRGEPVTSCGFFFCGAAVGLRSQATYGPPYKILANVYFTGLGGLKYFARKR